MTCDLGISATASGTFWRGVCSQGEPGCAPYPVLNPRESNAYSNLHVCQERQQRQVWNGRTGTVWLCIPSTRLLREVLFPGLPRGVGFGHSPLPSQPLPQDVSEGCWKRLPTLCVNRAAPPREVIFPCVFRQGRLCWKTSIQALPWWIFLRLEVGKLRALTLERQHHLEMAARA